MSKKVCMLVAHHPFLDARIFKKEAKSLLKKGYRVTLIVPRNNGSLFDIDGTPFKKRFRNKVFTYEGIKIVTYHYESCSGPLGKVLSDEREWESQGFNNLLTQLAIQENADIYHAHEYLSLFAGVGVKRIIRERKGKDVKLIYDSHELTPDPLDSRYSEERRNVLKQKLLIMLDEVDYVITVSDSIKSWYLSHKPNLPVEVIYNSPPLSKNFQPKMYSTEKITVGYVGNIYGNSIKNKIINISEICSRKMNYQFKIIGGSRFADSISIPKHLRANIILTGWVDYYTIPKVMEDVDIGLIDMGNVEHSLNSNYALPNKFFSYLNNGIPVIVNKCYDMEDLISKHRCGYVVDKKQATAQDFADAIVYLNNNNKLLEQMSQNGRSVMEKLYSWEKMEGRLYHVYQCLQ